MKRRRTITVILAVLAVLILIVALVTTAPRDPAVVPTEDPNEERQATVTTVL